MMIKRCIDTVLALLMMVVAVPVIALAALVIKLTSRGPVLYWQTRVGLNGKEFSLCKLRTMVHNAEALTGPVWAMKADPRVTSFGVFLRRSHIDELPQLVNVLAGQMSLIGPRPERPEFVATLDWELPQYTERHKVRPGITGLAQLRLPPDSSVESVNRKLQHDLYYVTHLNPWLDFRVLVFTALHFFREFTGMALGLFALPKIEEPLSTETEELTLKPVGSSQNRWVD